LEGWPASYTGEIMLRRQRFDQVSVGCFHVVDQRLLEAVQLGLSRSRAESETRAHLEAWSASVEVQVTLEMQAPTSVDTGILGYPNKRFPWASSPYLDPNQHATPLGV